MWLRMRTVSKCAPAALMEELTHVCRSRGQQGLVQVQRSFINPETSSMVAALQGVLLEW